MKNREKDEQKNKNAFNKHMVEMKKNRDALPKPVIDRSIRSMQQTKEVLIERVTLTIGGRVLLEEAKIQLGWGRKYGLIGRNGIGKTCLLAALARGEFGGFKGLQVLLVE